jgi:MarR family transcriptional regulator, protease production regulatory protein HPr
MKEEQSYSLKEAMIFSHKVGQLSKALWKVVEKDWQTWIKPYGLNINEHHILWISYYLEGASISDISKFGVMHVSTAFNFSKKLEERGYLNFSKKENDKRNTYVFLTETGKELLLNTLENYQPSNDGVLNGSLPLRNLYGKFPEFTELMCVVREIYGDDFTSIFEKSFQKIEDDYKNDELSVDSLLEKKEVSSK